MPRYKVVLNEICDYTLYVEADNEEDAAKKAEEAFIAAPDFKEMDCEVHERECVFVELADK